MGVLVGLEEETSEAGIQSSSFLTISILNSMVAFLAENIVARLQSSVFLSIMLLVSMGASLVRKYRKASFAVENLLLSLVPHSS